MARLATQGTDQDKRAIGLGQMIDTTPLYPRPSTDRIEAAIRHMYSIMEYIAPGSRIDAGFLVRVLIDRGESTATAMWALHVLHDEGCVECGDIRKNPRNQPLVSSSRPPSGLSYAKGVVHIGNAGSHSWSYFAFTIDHTKLAERMAADNDSAKEHRIKWPDNPDVRDLCAVLARDGGGTKSEIEIAREFAAGDNDKAENLLRQARRFPHLWKLRR